MTQRRRPDRETALRLLAASGKYVTLTEQQLREDVDGRPYAVEAVEHTGMLYVTAQMLGYEPEELENDDEDES